MNKLSLNELGRLTAAEYEKLDKIPLVIVLDNIRSAMNVGSIFRTADGLAVQEIILSGITAQPPHKEITKTAIGATRTVAWRHTSDLKASLQELKTDGYELMAVEQTDKSVKLGDYSCTSGAKLVLVFGNEVDGVSPEALSVMDGALEIQQYGTKHSFNVAVCAGMVLWEVARQLRG